MYDAVALAAAAGIFLGVRLHRPAERWPAYCLGAGVLCFALGDAVRGAYKLALGGPAPFPSAADVLYVGSYLPLGLGAFLLARRLGLARGLIDPGIVALGVAAPIWDLMVEPYAGREGLTGLERVLATAYPSMNVALVLVLAPFASRTALRVPAVRGFAAGVVLVVLADFALFGTGSDGYATGGWLSAAYLLGYVLWGAAALHPSMAAVVFVPAREPSLFGVSSLLLVVAGLFVPAMLVLGAVAGRLGVVEVAIAAALVTVVLVRIARTMLELERLHVAERRLRAEAETARADADAARQQLAEQNRRLRELDRAKDEFLSLVSHDFRTPLTSIVGYSELLLDEQTGPLSANQRRFLAIVVRNSTRLTRLVEDIMFVARVREGRVDLQVEPADLAVLARDCVETVKPYAESARVELTLADPSPAPVAGDPARLAQLLDNLIANAVKFTPAGGRVEVRVRQSNGSGVVEVSDTGIGIPPAEQPRLFERFFRASTATARHVPGTGLGLTIVKLIADAHGGHVSLTSEEEVGTTFRLELPLRAEAGAQEPGVAAGRTP